jgi:hypothetical protein
MTCKMNPGEESDVAPSHPHSVRLHYTIESSTTHGKSSALIISIASDVLPDPELPAMPTRFMSAHGGE